MFKTGKGFDYDTGDAKAITNAISKHHQPLFDFKLVQEVFPAVLPNELLLKFKTVEAASGEGGFHIADVGGGAGQSLIAMSCAYPDVTFHLVEISPEALKQAKINIENHTNRTGQKLNIVLHNVKDSPLSVDLKFDFVFTHDAIHDMETPETFGMYVYSLMKKGAMWMVMDCFSKDSHCDNITSRAGSALAYAISLSVCLPSGLGVDGTGLGLGTLGFNRNLAKQWSENCGFTSFIDKTKDVAHVTVKNCFLLTK